MTRRTPPSGFRDWNPDELRQRRALERAAAAVLETAGAQEISTSTLEEPQLSDRGAGESSDIVTKERFSVRRSGSEEELTLRPEGTAAMARLAAFMPRPGPVTRLYATGPMYRAERPQRGRLREFHQISYEAFGMAGPLTDAEAITLMHACAQACQVNATLHVGSIGDAEDRARINATLRKVFRNTADAQETLNRNPLRLLDHKGTLGEEARARVQVTELLSDPSRERYEQVCAALEATGIPFVREANLVRGLDYYAHTTWELRTDQEGPSAVLGGGGHYPELCRALTGTDLPGTGWALGVERLLLAAPRAIIPPVPQVYVIPIAGAQEQAALRLATQLRAAGLRTELHPRGQGPGRGLRAAAELRSEYAALLGEEELQRGEVTLRALQLGTQRRVPQDAVITELLSAFAAVQ